MTSHERQRRALPGLLLVAVLAGMAGLWLSLRDAVPMLPGGTESAAAAGESARSPASAHPDGGDKAASQSTGPMKEQSSRDGREKAANADRRKPLGDVPTAAQQAALAELRNRVPGVEVRFDPVTGAPDHILATGRFLTPPAPVPVPVNGDFHEPVRRFIDENAALFGHASNVLQGAKITREDVAQHNGMRTVVWQQQMDSVPVYKAVFRASLTKNGQLITAGSHFLAAAEAATGMPVAERATLIAQPPVDAARAISFAAADLGDRVVPADIRAVSAPDGVERRQRMEAPGLSDTNAGLCWLPMGAGPMRLAWDVTIMSLRRGEMFRSVVDAKTGEVLVRTSLTNDISDASYRVHAHGTNLKPFDSPRPFSPGPATPDTTQAAEVGRNLITLGALDITASPNGWINDGGTATFGNNVDAHLDLSSANPSYGNGTHAVSATRVFDFPMDLTQAPSAYQSAAITHLFYLCNWYHDRLYALGFTESAGNFQQNNFGRGGLGNDAVLADAQDGSGTDNANFSTPPDGSPGRMQMYVFTGPNPDRDGDLDGEIVLHEYTHGLSNRLVGGGVGISALQSAGMGEGWSDFYAIALLSEESDDVNGNYAAGAYATHQLGGLTQNYYYGIRRYPYSTDMTKNPLTLKDIDPTRASSHPGIPRSPIIGGSADEVHNSGEVWCVTLWEVRANLIAKHGWATGNELALQLVTDGMKLAPSNPTFLQARDAIVQADVVNNTGANHSELWTAFAKRGMGAGAIVPASSTATGVTESFDLPDDLNVTPNGAIIAAGPVGGPFTPDSQTYTLTNTDPAVPLYWTASSSQPWLTVTPVGGSLAPGVSTTVTAVVTSAAAALAAGSYTGTISFINTTSGANQPRTVTLVSGGADYFTEVFDTSLNDTDNQSWLFTPNGSNSFYSVLRAAVSAFPTDPAGGTTLSMVDDSATQVTPSGGSQDSLYGVNYSTFHVGSNGYVTFGSSDTSYAAELANHFAKPRIAALLSDLDPTAQGNISWKQTADRMAVTWQNVPDYGATNSNNFQIELFFDGRVRITCLGIAGTRGLIGLSQGAGTPANFVESDFSGYGTVPAPALQLAVPTPATEGDGVLAGQASVSIVSALVSDLVVSLGSSNTQEVTVPTMVTIPAGQLSAAFDVTILDDVLLDGTQDAVITAGAAGFTGAVRIISVQDNETATLSVTAPATTTEGAGVLQGMVSVSTPPARAVLVSLISSATSAIQVSATVVIPAGQASVNFPITVVDDNVIDGTENATITAHVANWTDGAASISVQDNENNSITVSAPLQVTEGGVYAGTVSISGTVTSALIVSLASNNTSRLAVPATVTIPPGSASAPFTFTAPDNSLTDGTAFATITASAAGFTDGSITTDVFDDDVHHFNVGNIASPQTRGLPFSVTLTAKDVNGVTIAGYAGNPSLSAAGSAGAVTISPASASGFINGVWTGAVTAGTFDTDVVLTVSDGLGHSGTSNPFDIVVGALHHFAWNAVPGTQTAGAPFGVTLTAQDAGNNIVTTFAGNANLSGKVSALSNSSIVITEVNPNTPDEIEFMNVASSPLDISGWTVSIYDFDVYPGAKSFTIPSGTTCGAGQLFRLQEFGVAPGAFPLFSLGANINWTSDSGSPVAVLLQNASGDIVDFFCAGAGSPSLITSPVSIPGSQWTGPTVGTPLNLALDYARTGGSDGNSAADWITAPPGPGTLNPGLTTPFTVSLSVPITPAVSGGFLNGSWTGNITIFQAALQMTLHADDGAGHSGVSNAFDVIGTVNGNPQSVGVPFRSPTRITLTGQDSANPDAVLTFAIGTPPARGTLAGAPPNMTYTPTGAYYGADSFTFTVSNGTIISPPVAISITVVAPPVIVSAPLNSDPGWARQGQWAFGVPTGAGGVSFGNSDPTGGVTGANVIGVNLNGDYSTDVGGPYYLTAGPFNLSNHIGTLLRFARWLNTDYQPYVSATVEVSTDGSTWSTVWNNGNSREIADSSWRTVEYDISALADNKAAVYVRWGYRVNSGAYPYSGWNLDDIQLLAIPPLVVTTNLDEDDGTTAIGTGDSLRECIAAAKSDGAFIVFAPSLSGQTITLGSQLLIDKVLTIDGSSLAAGVVVDGNANSRLFEVQSGASLVLESLALTRGKANASGGALSNAGSLKVSRCTVSHSLAFASGGGIANSGSLTVENSTLTENFAVMDGGGIGGSGAVTVRHTTIVGNTAFFSNGGGIMSGGTLTLENSVVAMNTAQSAPNVAGPITSQPGSSLITGNPRLAPLNHYGGRTKTMPPLPGSPVIEAAVMLGSTPLSDQRGDVRPNGSLPDIGAVEAFAFSSLAAIDSDADWIDDRIEPAYGLTVGLNDYALDSDGDGFTDASELGSMTDPLDANSYLKIVSFTQGPGFDPVTNPVFNLTFTSFPGLSYSAECEQGLNFAGSGVHVVPLGEADSFTRSVQILMLPNYDFVRVRRND
ncbi:MAG: M36 family metallopeptidase [Chthoniobacteraceae bacterium]